MKMAMARLFACVLLTAESSILLPDANSLQSWGQQEEFLAVTPTQKQQARADAAAREMAAWMPVSKKLPRMDLEVERLEYKVRRSLVGAVGPRRHIRNHRVAAPSRNMGRRVTANSQNHLEQHRNLAIADGTAPVAKWLAHSHPGSHKETRSAVESSDGPSRNQIRAYVNGLRRRESASGQVKETRAATQKPEAQLKPPLSNEGIETALKPAVAASTPTVAGSSRGTGVSSSPTPQKAFASRAAGRFVQQTPLTSLPIL